MELYHEYHAKSSTPHPVRHSSMHVCKLMQRPAHAAAIQEGIGSALSIAQVMIVTSAMGAQCRVYWSELFSRDSNTKIRVSVRAAQCTRTDLSTFSFSRMFLPDRPCRTEAKMCF